MSSARRCLPSLLLASMILVGSLAFAQAASAANICVAPNTTCGGQNVATLQQALDIADDFTTDDHVYLGAATYVAPTTAGYQYTPTKAPIELVGAGTGKTVVTGPAGSVTTGLMLTGGGAWVHDLTVNIPANVAAGYTGLITDGYAERIAVTESPAQTNARNGVLLKGGATLYDSTVAVGDQNNNAGVVFFDPGATVEHCVVSAGVAIAATYAGTIDRSRLYGTSGLYASSGTTTITRSLIKFSSAWGSGIGASPSSQSDVSLVADGVVIAGPGGGASIGVSAGTALNPTRNADVTLVNSVIRGAVRPLFAYANGTGHAKLAVSYSDYDPAGTQITGPGATVPTSDNTNLGAAAGFADAAAGDFHLQPGSPLIDGGDPSSTAGLFIDLDGGPLITDGNGDGAARRDVGPFEAPAVPFVPVLPAADPAPVDPGGTSSPSDPAAVTADAAADTLAPVLSRLALRRRTSFRYTLSEAARVTIKLQRATVVRGHKRWRATGALTRQSTAGPNSVRFSGRVGKRALRRGSYRALVSAVDAAGNRSAAKQLSFRIVAR